MFFHVSKKEPKLTQKSRLQPKTPAPQPWCSVYLIALFRRLSRLTINLVLEHACLGLRTRGVYPTFCFSPSSPLETNFRSKDKSWFCGRLNRVKKTSYTVDSIIQKTWYFLPFLCITFSALFSLLDYIYSHPQGMMPCQ